MCILTRLVALLATLTLATAVLFRSPAEYRVLVCIIVSLATVTLAARTLASRKPVWTLLFLAILCIFTPFQIGRFSHGFISVVDMASLALFAVWPMILRNSTTTTAPARIS